MDIVYFCREGVNEEFRYSLRSIKNLPHDKVWVYGGCPSGIHPDTWVSIDQVGGTKWDRVKNMFREVCLNKEISEDFILMNDDFFIMEPTELPLLHREDLPNHIINIELKYGNRITPYTYRLRECLKLLRDMGKTEYSYELHIPFVFNKKKLLKLIEAYPTIHATRSLYGNYYNIGGSHCRDVKVLRGQPDWKDNWAGLFLSTDDESFDEGVGDYIRKAFPEKSEYETN